MSDNNCINSPKEIGRALKANFKSRKLSQEAVAAANGMHQSQVSRVVRGQFKKVDGSVKALCKYASLSIIVDKRDPSTNPKLMSALSNLWDGSERHADAIAKVLTAMGQINQNQ